MKERDILKLDAVILFIILVIMIALCLSSCRTVQQHERAQEPVVVDYGYWKETYTAPLRAEQKTPPKPVFIVGFIIMAIAIWQL
jgi:hypothetical protein